MAIADEDQVKGLLDDFEQRLRSIVERAWAEWRSQPSAQLVFMPRYRANFMFDAIARHALNEFRGDPEIRVIANKQTIKFLVRDRVLLRYKKSNGNGVGSNIETQAVLDFVVPERSFPGLLDEVHRVEICWSHDDLGIGLREVAVVARDRRKRVWSYAIPPAGGAAIIPHPSGAPGPDIEPPVVLPKRRPLSDTGSE